MTEACEYTLDLQFDGPLLSQAAGVLPLQYDSAMLRYRDQPVLPGSLIRGNIRHALAVFAADLPDPALAAQLRRWFGSPGGAHDSPGGRAAVDFDFFWRLTEGRAPAESARRNRIRLEQDGGRAQRGMLQSVEDCFPLGGDPAVFRGRIYARHSDDERREFSRWLCRALDDIPAFGSYKGIGFGKLAHWQLSGRRCAATVEPGGWQLPADETRFGIRLRLDRPFCLGRPRTPDSNRVVSDEFIAGNVIKAVIARHYPADCLQRELGFDQLIVTQARPVKMDAERPERPSPLPLSLARQREATVDMACARVEDVIAGGVPAFSPDWKQADEDAVKQEWGIAKPPRRYHALHTAIEAQTGLSAEGELFTLDCVDPQGFEWWAEVELGQIEDAVLRQGAYRRLRELFAGGLHGIGKTKARAEVVIGPPWWRGESPPPPARLTGGCHIVTLQSAARLLPPNLKLRATNSHTALRRHYQAYWQRHHGGLVLVDYYARQQLTGSYYHRHNHAGHSGYFPEWLTAPGSVFVLKAADDEALALLSSWCRSGLPAHPNADGSLADWRSTPFLPEHGFGEILLNDARQLERLYEPVAAMDEVPA